MSVQVTRAHILAQLRLRDITAAAIARLWASLPGYDEEHVEPFLATVVPLILAAQNQSVSLTDAAIAQALDRGPLGIDPGRHVGAAVRADVPPEQVYRRPFVTVWSALQAGTRWEEAVSQGLAHARGSGALDVQLSMRSAAREIGEEDPDIYGFKRVPDGRACALCLVASTQRYHTADLMPIHNWCGCGVQPITEPTGHIADRDLYRKLKADGELDKLARQRAKSDTPVTAEVQEHGELGPVLTNADHQFTQL